MPLTTLDPRTALVVVDLQKGIVTLDVAHPMDGVVSRSAELAAAFRERGLPVVLVNVTGGAPGRTDAQRSGPARPAPAADWAELVEELAASDTDLLVTKERWGAFTGTSLHERLQELGVTQVVLTGVSTSVGVESTARSAYELGYHVTLATDAMTDREIAAHDYSVQRVFPRLGETATTAEILAELARPAAP
jgi:nicotinamidase-related amidase